MKNQCLLIGSILLAIFLLVTFLGPNTKYVEEGIQEKRIIMGEGEIKSAPFAPSKDHVFGTDNNGRDILSIIIAGAKDTILLILAITFIRYVIAFLLVLLSMIWRGPFTWVINWWNQLSSGLPIIFAAILFITLPIFTYSPNRMIWVIAILALIEVGRVGYIIRQKADSISRTQFVEAGVTLGTGPIRLFTNYYIPNLMPQIIVNFCIDLGRVALLLGQLGIFYIFVTQEFVQTSYGTGELMNTSMNWATLLSEARGDLLRAFWIPFFPACAITFIILTFNILGEGLRQYFDKRENANI